MILALSLGAASLHVRSLSTNAGAVAIRCPQGVSKTLYLIRSVECSLHCKPLTDIDIVAIVTLRAALEGAVQNVPYTR